jgi:hypothetical protein
VNQLRQYFKSKIYEIGQWINGSGLAPGIWLDQDTVPRQKFETKTR